MSRRTRGDVKKIREQWEFKTAYDLEEEEKQLRLDEIDYYFHSLKKTPLTKPVSSFS